MAHEDALVLRLWDFSETSQTAALFTRGRGIVRCLAKGSKRPRAKFSGGLELITRGEAVLIVKPGAELAQLIEWDLGECYFGLRRSVDAHLAGAYAADLVFRCVTDHDPHERLFVALADTLRRVDDGALDRAIILDAMLRFQWDVLRETGYAPSLEVDVRTGASLEARSSYGFDPRLGGITRDPGAGGEVWRVRSETVRVLRTLASGSSEVVGGGDAPTVGPGEVLGSEVAVRCVRLLAAWIGAAFGEVPASQEVFLERLTRN